MKPNLSRKDLQPRHKWIPYFVLAIALLFTAGATSYVAMTANAKDRLRFENAVQRTQDDIQDRIETYIALLRAGSGLFAASEDVSREEFRAFVNRLKLRERYPGIQGIGFSIRVQPKAKDALVADMQRQGIKNFSIRPNFPRREYHAIVYLEPLERRNQAAIGFDMFVEAVRRTAMERARDTAAPAASGKVTLVQEIDQQKQAGFLLYVPVYRDADRLDDSDILDTVAERRARLLGFVYSPFRANDLLGRIFGSEKSRRVNFQIYDGRNFSHENLLYSSWNTSTTNNPSYQPRFSTTRIINIAGRPWSIVFTSRPELELTSASNLVPWIGFVGVVMSLVLFGITRSLTLARNAAERSAAALRESEKRFRRLVESNIFGVAFADFHGSIHYANDYFLQLVGYERKDLLAGKVRWDKITPPEFLHLDAQAAELTRNGVATPFEKEYIRQDGARVPILIGSALLQEPYTEQQEIIAFFLDLSDRYLAAAAIRQSEERYRSFIEQSSEGIWRFELEQPLAIELPEDEQIQHFYQYAYLAECNNVMAQMYGFSGAEELVGAGLADFLVDSEPLNTEYLRRFIRSGYKLNAAESYEVDKEGKPKYFLNSLVGIVENGFLVRAWGTQIDITERKQVQEALRCSEERYRSLVEATSQIIWDTNAEGELVTQQPGWSAFTGQTFEQLKGWGWLSAVHPDDRARTAQVWSHAVANRTLYEVEHRLRRYDGEYRYMSVRAVPVLESDGSIREWVGVQTDITERKQTEAALKESEDRFRKLAEKVRVIPWEADATTGNFTYVGPQTAEILGYPLSNWYSNNFWTEHIHPEDREWAVKYCQEKSLVCDNYEFEYRMLAADGRVVWLYDIVNVVRDENGPQLLRGFMIDTTDRKQAEAEREQLLEREQAARAEAEAANRMKDEFLATLSHELRTPLNAMLGWTQLLRTRKFNEATTARALETIDRNTKSLAQLIEDVLDVSRIVTGKLRLNVRPVELVPIIEAAIETVQPAAAAKEIHIELVLGSLVGKVLGDATRLQQVVWNLLANAIKFTPTGGRVEVRLGIVDSRAQIQVSDTGQGISLEFLPHVFERFRQADSSITRTQGGLGLGLAIVRHLVELHGGTVRADSPGLEQGATFTVELPIKAVAHDLPASKPEQELQSSIVNDGEVLQLSPRSLNGLRVLIVDDEPDARDLVATVLEQHGAQVKVESCAADALETSEIWHPEVLVSDIGMPGEDGYTLIRKLRALEQQRGGKIPAVALTAYARAEDRTQALAAGFQLYLAKPVNPSELAEVVGKLAERNNLVSS